MIAAGALPRTGAPRGGPARRERLAGAGGVRPAEPADLGALVDLHRRAFAAPAPRDDLEALLGALFFGHPWRETAIPSLVCEREGAIAGALGVLPRPMELEGAALTAALGHNLMVEPARRGSTVALELMRAFLCGAQQLSLAWGNDAARRIWRGLGIEPLHAWSLRFTLLLKPASHLLEVAGRQGHDALAGWLRPAALLADRLAPREPGPRAGSAAEGPLDVAAHCEVATRFGRRRRLRPVYRPEALRWMLDLGSRGGEAPPRAVLVRRGGSALGWYLARERPRDVVELLQLGGATAALPELFDRLVAEARARGAAAITGALDPAWLPALDERPCLYHRGRSAPWVLAHGRDDRGRGALEALRAGDASLSRLEGEWWA
jgi:hypothetical protein